MKFYMMKLKTNFENELLLEKGKEAVFDLQDDLEDLLASGSTFSEISETLDVELIKANKINRKGIDIKGEKLMNFRTKNIKISFQSKN